MQLQFVEHEYTEAESHWRGEREVSLRGRVRGNGRKQTASLGQGKCFQGRGAYSGKPRKSPRIDPPKSLTCRRMMSFFLILLLLCFVGFIVVVVLKIELREELCNALLSPVGFVAGDGGPQHSAGAGAGPTLDRFKGRAAGA